MCTRAYLPILGLGLVLGFGALLNTSGSAAEKADAKQIAGLVQQLGSDNFEEREQASKKLAEIGEPALEALRKASKEASDAEVHMRADDLIHRIEEQIKKAEKRAEAEKLLVPTKVHLVFKDTPLLQAVADFQKKSGFALTLQNPATLADRKVTLDTGEVSFWQAFDKFSPPPDWSNPPSWAWFHSSLLGDPCLFNPLFLCQLRRLRCPRALP